MKDSRGKVVWDQGYNAYPIKEGRCCSACDKNLVMPARLKE